ncbi:hypothetical protein PV08_11408 [Exophiala spinifera]|uniref:FAD/NAD(P)-binding domain-containing protein n=1 Tax=Exophiala spinifera TaxID=91928 RepID=A0A0D2BGI2_9EURO|nr:uncharacterized protein PV08_11408 [Exophiala spinifera]KIW10444.1 hypothetical protein PV08_11408 [Exophiala spinifera]
MITQPTSEYQILPQYHSQPRRLKIIHVGAGASGLLFAYKAKRLLLNYELTCYEKNPSIGGTWFENKYPGCACDIPAHTYTYPFQPNTEWSGFYSCADEILAYFQNFHDEHELAPYIKLSTEVPSATWDEDSAEWEIELKNAEGIFKDRCHVLINGAGVVNKWKWPAIEGRELYKGILSHSANWDTSIKWEGKRVAVIRTGSSSIQMVPQMAKGSQTLTVFARNSTYISPLVSPGDYRVHPDGKHHYLEVEKEVFRTDPARHLQYRKDQETVLTKQFPIFIRGTPESVMAKEALTAQMLARIGPGHDELKKRFIPDWAPGCRRLTPGEGYLETLVLDHVRVAYDEIDRFTETGVVTAAGEELDFDIMACATGFDVSFIPHFNIVGRKGVSMREEWKGNVNIYLGITAPNYPNYFVIDGPTANWGNGCVMPSHEVHIEYALKCCRKLQEDRRRAFSPWSLDRDRRPRSGSTWILGTRNVASGVTTAGPGTKTTGPTVASTSGQEVCCTISRPSGSLATSTTTCGFGTRMSGPSWVTAARTWRSSGRTDLTSISNGPLHQEFRRPLDLGPAARLAAEAGGGEEGFVVVIATK